MLSNLGSQITLLGAILAGIALGIVFFGGLWWTVQRAGRSSKPALWFVGSLLVRVSIVMIGFYLVGAGQLLQIGMCLVGFVLARVGVLRWSRNRKAPFVQAFIVPANLSPKIEGEKHASNP